MVVETLLPFVEEATLYPVASILLLNVTSPPEEVKVQSAVAVTIPV